MRRILIVLVALWVSADTSVWAQTSELADLRAQLLKQQEVIAGLLKRLEALEHKEAQPPNPAELQQEIKTQQDAVASLGEAVRSKVNLNGYYNFRYVNDDTAAKSAFQQHQLAVILGKQLSRWNFLMELELQNVPHHREGGGGGELEGLEGTEDVAEGEVEVETGWAEYSHNRYVNVRAGKQRSPQYFWSHRYPNLTLSSDLPIYLRELFPPELVGVMVHGSVARPVGGSEFGFGYRAYVANNQVVGISRIDQDDRKAWGGRLQFQLPVTGLLKKADVAVDGYHGRVQTDEHELVSDTVWGVEEQIEVGPFQLYSEYARGNSLGVKRSGYYVQPAVRLSDQLVGFYRLERLNSRRIHRNELRHLGGINFRPYPQIAVKFEYFRSLPRDLGIHFGEEEERRPFNGIAAAAVFFF